MRTVTCERCGKENKVDVGILELHKCSFCEDIKFDRAFFVPIEQQVLENFKKAQVSRFGSILKGLYLFGSYARKECKCGDIDFLATYSRPRLRSFVRSETVNFHGQFDFFFPGISSFSELEAMLKKSFWDFRTCEEYPDCLGCYEESACRLPSEDYHSKLHVYCLEKCRCKTRNPIPDCCFGGCTFLEGEINNKIIEEISSFLKEELAEFREVKSGLRVKIIDMLMRPSVRKLAKEFESRKYKAVFQAYKIHP